MKELIFALALVSGLMVTPQTQAQSITHRLLSTWVSNLLQLTGHDAYDVSNPAAPQHLFSDSTTFGAGGEYGASDYAHNVLLASKGGGVVAYDVTPAGHMFKDYFSGQDVPNVSVAITSKDSVFFNVRRGGIEVLHYPMQIQVTSQPAELASDGLAVFPNPLSGQELRLEISAEFNGGRLEILDASGRCVYQTRLNPSENGKQLIRLTEKLAPGLYMISVITNTIQSRSRLMVD